MKCGDVFDARLNPTEGSEQAGTQPIVIVSRDATNVKRDYPNNVRIARGEGGLTVNSVLLGGQVRAIAKSRLLRQRGTLSADIMREVDRALRITLDL